MSVSKAIHSRGTVTRGVTIGKEVIGLIPAAGHATRVGRLPCSKELFPIGFHSANESTGVRPKVVSCYLLEKMRLAGIRKAYIVLRQGKWDIPSYLGDGAAQDMHLAYLMQGLPYGVPYTLDQAHPFVSNAIVALGFPDILFQPANAYARLLERLKGGDVDVVLGLFPADQPQKVDVVELAPPEEEDYVRRVIVKPQHHTSLRYTWGIAVWTPAFTRFMHRYLSGPNAPIQPGPELHVGHVIHEAIVDGLRVAALHISNTPFLDIGTPANLVAAVRGFSED